MIERSLERWSLATCRHPGRVALLACVAAIVFVTSTSRLTFETELDSMVPTRSAPILAKIDRIFGVREQSFLVVESPREDQGTALLAFARALEETLEGNELIADVVYGFAELREALLSELAPYGPRFATKADAVEKLFTAEDLDERIARQVARLSLPGFGDAEPFVRRDPLDLGSFLWQRLSALRGAYRFDPSSPHFLSEDGRALLVRIQGESSLEDLDAVERTGDVIESAVDRALRAVPEADLTVSAGGGYFLGRESQQTIRADLIAALTISMVFVLGLVAWTLRHALSGLLVVPPLLLGLMSGVGFLSFFQSHLPLISMGSSAIQIGLGVDFAIHLMLRSRALRAGGSSVEESVGRAAAQTGPGLLFAALTTCAAFLVFVFSRFEFLVDMGILTALGIAGTLIATVSLLPPLGRLWLGRGSDAARPPRTLGVDRVVRMVLIQPAATLAVGLSVSAAALLAVVWNPPEFESNLKNIHARDSDALRAEARMAELFGGSQEPLLVMLEERDTAVLEQKLRRLRQPLDRLVDRGTLVAHSSAALFLPERDREAAVIRILSSRDAGRLRTEIDAALERGGFDAAALSEAVDRSVTAAVDPRPLTIARLRDLGLADWIDLFVREDPDRSGTHVALVTLLPTEELWDPGHRRQVLAEIEGALVDAGLRSADGSGDDDAEVVGLFTISAESADLVGAEMTWIGLLALSSALGIVLVLFRGTRLTLLTLVPVTLGCVWTAALFRWLGYNIHFLNAGVLPMVIGIGIDDGIHILHRYRTLRADSSSAANSAASSAADTVRQTLSVTGTAVALTSLTTMIAFGSLAFSRNRGLSSVGVLCLIGVSASLLASITVLPALLYFVERGRRRREGGEAPAGRNA